MALFMQIPLLLLGRHLLLPVGCSLSWFPSSCHEQISFLINEEAVLHVGLKPQIQFIIQPCLSGVDSASWRNQDQHLGEMSLHKQHVIKTKPLASERNSGSKLCFHQNMNYLHIILISRKGILQKV